MGPLLLCLVRNALVNAARGSRASSQVSPPLRGRYRLSAAGSPGTTQCNAAYKGTRPLVFVACLIFRIVTAVKDCGSPEQVKIKRVSTVYRLPVLLCPCALHTWSVFRLARITCRYAVNPAHSRVCLVSVPEMPSTVYTSASAVTPASLPGSNTKPMALNTIGCTGRCQRHFRNFRSLPAPVA
jgi:hypothetical protein